jgi:hypothetical protein
MDLAVTNAGQVPALAVRAELYGCRERYSPLLETRKRSNAHANLAPGAEAMLKVQIDESMLTADPGPRWQFPYLVVALSYSGPHGGIVTHRYDYNTESHAWRMRRIEIDPRDGGPPMVTELSL